MNETQISALCFHVEGREGNDDCKKKRHKNDLYQAVHAYLPSVRKIPSSLTIFG